MKQSIIYNLLLETQKKIEYIESIGENIRSEYGRGQLDYCYEVKEKLIECISLNGGE